MCVLETEIERSRKEPFKLTPIMANVQSSRRVIVRLPGVTTGSYGCVVKLLHHSKPSMLINLLQQYTSKIDVFAYDHNGQRSKVDANEFCNFLVEQGCTLALKIFRASFGKNTNGTPKSVFLNELQKAGLVRSCIGNESFYTYTTYRFFNDACGFAVRPAEGSRIRLSLQHKPDYIETDVDEIYLVLNEACAFSIDHLGRKDASGNAGECTSCNGRSVRFDAQEMDQCISRILKVLHENGVVHKDIKPTNIVYCPFSYIRYKLVDYAFASVAHVIPHMLIGSRAFMSPFYVGSMNRLISMGTGVIGSHNADEMQRILALYDQSCPEYSSFYRVLIRGHLVSLRRSNQLDSHAYLEFKNDEYGYMMSLFNIYTLTQDPVLLARATGI